MIDKTFTPSLDLIRPSFQLIKTHFNAVLWLVYLPALLMGLGQMLVSQVVAGHHYESGTLTLTQLGSDILDAQKGQLGLSLMAVGLLWSLLVFPSIIVGTLQSAKGGEFDPVHTFKNSRRYFWRVIGLTILITVIVEIGLILFIIPGVIALRMLLMAPYYLVDKDLGIMEALRVSARRSRLSRGPIYGVIGVLFWLFVGGAMLGLIPVIGIVLSLFVTYLYLFGPALRYIEIKGQSGDKKSAGRRRKN